MAKKLPKLISRRDIGEAIDLFRSGQPHSFGQSTGYDILYEGERLPPKAIVGIAASKVTGKDFTPQDFGGGLGTHCFKIIEQAGFEIVTKGDTSPFPDEVNVDAVHIEGSIKYVAVNRYERDPEARMKCIEHHGSECTVCGFNFEKVYGVLGVGFIHVHHILPISQIGKEYVVDPLTDLVPVCPNCHAMLHKRTPPFSINELRKTFA